MAKKIVAYLGDFPIPYPYVEADVDSASSGEDVLTLHPMSCNTYTATDADILVEGVHLAAIAGTVRELLLVIDCTDLEEVPELSFSGEFDMFEGGDSSAVALSPETYNVYRVIEYLPGHFSVYAGMSPAAVTGVKGAAESSYRIGNVNLTPENIGAISQAALDSKSFIKSPDGDTVVSADNDGTAKIARPVQEAAWTVVLSAGATVLDTANLFGTETVPTPSGMIKQVKWRGTGTSGSAITVEQNVSALTTSWPFYYDVDPTGAYTTTTNNSTDPDPTSLTWSAVPSGVSLTATKGAATHTVSDALALSSQVPALSDVNPQMDGTASPGSAAAAARSDHVHPTDTSRASTADATLTARSGFSDWSFSPSTTAAGHAISMQIVYDEVYDVHFYVPFANGAEIGDRLCTTEYDPAATSLTWGVDEWTDGNTAGPLVATRTALQGYQLGTQSDKPLASEAEAEALRDGVAEANAQTEVVESKPNSPHLLADAFPITFTLDSIDYTISDGDSRLSFGGSSEFTMFVDGSGVCDFKSDNTFRRAWAQAEDLKFNGRDPVEGVWPVLHFAVSDVKVRDVSVLMKSAVVPPSASATTGQAADAKATGDALVTITPDWVQTSAYAAYDCVKYNNAYYYAKTDIAANTAWNANNWGSLANLAALAHLFLPLTGGTVNGMVWAKGGLSWGSSTNSKSTISNSGISLHDGTKILSYPSASGTLALLENITPAFSTSATYALNELCVYNRVLYRCTTAITTAESWTPAHWTEAKVEDVLAALRTAIAGKEDASNKVTSLTAQSTDTQYPSAKCVYDALQGVDAKPTRIYNEAETDALDDKGQLFKSSMQGNYLTRDGTNTYTYVGSESGTYYGIAQTKYNYTGSWSYYSKSGILHQAGSSSSLDVSCAKDVNPTIPGSDIAPVGTRWTFTPLATTMETTPYAHFSLESLPDRTWSAGVWAVGDLVKYSGKAYRCKAATTASDTTAPSSDTTHWEEIPTLGGISATLGDIETALHTINNGSST